MVTLSARALCLGVLLSGAGCSYDWEEDGAVEPATPASQANAGPTEPGAKTQATPVTPATPTGGALFCDTVNAGFCDDFDGPPPRSVWDAARVRSPATLSVSTVAGAPSGTKVLELGTNLASNNPGEASVEQVVRGAATMRVSFWILKAAASPDKPVDVLRMTVPQRDGSTSTFTWKLSAAGGSSLVTPSTGAASTSLAAGELVRDAWTQVQLRLDASGAALTVGSNTVIAPHARAWNPAASGVALSLGLMNVLNQGGGWRLQFDSVTIE